LFGNHKISPAVAPDYATGRTIPYEPPVLREIPLNLELAHGQDAYGGLGDEPAPPPPPDGAPIAP